MTRSEEELTRDENIDQRVLVEHIKNDPFPKAKFVLGDGSDWNQRNMSEFCSEFFFGFSEILDPVSNGYGSDRINYVVSDQFNYNNL
jgi:hypothetical protein